MSVLIDNRQELIEVDQKLEDFVQKIVNAVLAYEENEENYEVSISFVNDEEIQDLNMEYRGINHPTDVLSFPMMDFEEEDEIIDVGEEFEYIEEELPLGDIVISIDRAKAQAQEYGHSFERELSFLLVHGMLHLLGYDHEEEKDEKVMMKIQEEILEILKINR